MGDAPGRRHRAASAHALLRLRGQVHRRRHRAPGAGADPDRGLRACQAMGAARPTRRSAAPASAAPTCAGTIRKPDTSGLVMLELNTQPGMTPLSLAPEQAKWAGISWPRAHDLDGRPREASDMSAAHQPRSAGQSARLRPPQEARSDPQQDRRPIVAPADAARPRRPAAGLGGAGGWWAWHEGWLVEARNRLDAVGRGIVGAITPFKLADVTVEGRDYVERERHPGRARRQAGRFAARHRPAGLAAAARGDRLGGERHRRAPPARHALRHAEGAPRRRHLAERRRNTR